MLIRADCVDPFELEHGNRPLKTFTRWVNAAAVATIGFERGAALPVDPTRPNERWALLELVNGVELVADIRAGTALRAWFSAEVDSATLERFGLT